jgi:Cu2+-exporting ATPase
VADGGSGGTCFHCGEDLPHRGVRHAALGGQVHPFCCAGCEAAAVLIRDAGLTDYYMLREREAPRVDVAADRLAAWDAPALDGEYCTRADGLTEITLGLDGMRCAACAWLIGEVLRREGRTTDVRVNAATQRATLAFDRTRHRLSEVLAPIAQLGYQPHLPHRGEDAARIAERRKAMKRLVVAGLGMMQAMMFAEALYFGADGSMDIPTRDLFRWLGFALAAPVVFYSGWPFLAGAWRELVRYRPGMDTLVAASVLLAWIGSLVETVRGGPDVYFDAAVMFVFLLLATRHVEHMARMRALSQVDALARAQPAVAHRIGTGGIEDVPTHALAVGDRVLVRAGESVPADGRLASSAASIAEALLTGEPVPVAKRAGDEVLAGSLAVGLPAEIVISRIGADTTLAGIVRLLDRAQAERPRAAEVADRIATRFVGGLLVVAVCVGAWWWVVEPARTLPVLLAVLAVTCPCALSLAVPASLAAAHARLARSGVLVVRPGAIQALASIERVVFDKTGTLTRGEPAVVNIECLADDWQPARAGAIAAALERAATHPLALALRSWDDPAIVVADAEVVAGAGVAGTIGGQRWRLGSPAWTGATGIEDGIVLAAEQPVARIVFDDPLRSDARAAVAALRGLGIAPTIASGDASGAVDRVAAALEIDAAAARLSPDDKLGLIQQFQRKGHRVMMVGDGINDAAVLAGADVSVALAHGAPLAHAAADIVLLGDRLEPLAEAVRVARATRRNLRQNLGWALAYNLIALPFAAAGLVAPWMAAVGMSVSSLVVTLNALRLARAPHAAERIDLDPTPSARHESSP